MTEKDDIYWLRMNRDDAVLQGAEALSPLQTRLAASFLPAPKTLEVTGRRDAAIEGWLDPKVAKAFDSGKPSIGLVAPGIQVVFGFSVNRTSLSLFFRPGPTAAEIRTLFMDLCALFSPEHASVGLRSKGQEIYDKYYAAHRRTFYASGLSWLNFFARDEEARQGGAALANNPYARVEHLANGLLLEVGSSPLDALSPEGEQRLVDATRAMPPLPPEPVAATAPPTAPEEPAAAPAPAPIIQVAGVRGFLDPLDHDFWVSKHIEPPRPLDAKTLRALAALPGKGAPPVKRVHVLFSTLEAARANKQALEAIGAHAWFVSLEDGKRAPA